jgi:outer membrane protein assembly factor BamB
MRERSLRRFLSVGATLLLAGCSTTPSWMPSWSIPAPNLDWLTGRSSASKPGPLPELTPSATARADWQVGVGRSRPGLSPTVVGDSVYAAASDGTLVRIEAATGRTVWRINASTALSAGPGADPTLVAVGTDEGQVLAFDPDGKPLWTAKVSSEVLSPPLVYEGVVVVSSGDGRVFGLSSADGKTKWVFQRVPPPLTVRNHAGAVASRGGVFIGLPGGRLVAMDVQTGVIGWEAAVATPKGTTELERIADITSRPLVEERQACATAFQGRLACFEVLRGALVWNRDIGSLSGLAADDAAYYVVDNAGALHALDKSTGASLWKQDRLAKRKLGGPQLAGEHVVVPDVEGQVHLFARSTGAYVGRLATDGSAATGQPLALGDRALWQSLNGNVYAVSTR